MGRQVCAFILIRLKNKFLIQGLKLKKSSVCLLTTNWRNIVARCKFVVASLYNVNDAVHSIRVSDIWRGCGATKFTKTCEIPQNSLEILSNTCWYNIFETYLSYWGCLIAVNLQIYLETLSPQRADNVPKLPGLNYVAKKLGTSHDVKNFAIGSFLECFVVRIVNYYLC